MATKDVQLEADREYFTRRAREEQSAAADAACPEARELHQRMAKLLDLRAHGGTLSTSQGARDRRGTIVHSGVVTLGRSADRVPR